MRKLAFRFIEGRAAEAPKFHILSRTKEEYEDGESYNGCEWVNTIFKGTSIVRLKMQKAKCNDKRSNGDNWMQAMLREQQMHWDFKFREFMPKHQQEDRHHIIMIISLLRDARQRSSTTLPTSVKVDGVVSAHGATWCHWDTD